jgi:hypothetical protein
LQQLQEQLQELLLERQLVLQQPELQMGAALHKQRAQVFQQSCSDSQRHFQTYITDRHRPCQRKLFSQLLTVLQQPVLVLAQVVLQIPHMQRLRTRGM